MSRRVIYTAGVWDLFHAQHLRILHESKGLGDLLVVGVLTDQGAAAYKRVPVVSEVERLRIVAGLRCVDAAFLQPSTNPTDVLEALAAVGLTPSVMTHGSDWTQLREGGDTLERLGIELVILDYGNGTGTTGLIERIRGGGLVATTTEAAHGDLA